MTQRSKGEKAAHSKLISKTQLAGRKGKNKPDDSADIKSSVGTQLLLRLIWLQQRWSLGKTKDGKEQPELRAE